MPRRGRLRVRGDDRAARRAAGPGPAPRDRRREPGGADARRAGARRSAGASHGSWIEHADAVVVASMGQGDEDTLQAALAAGPATWASWRARSAGRRCSSTCARAASTRSRSRASAARPDSTWGLRRRRRSRSRSSPSSSPGGTAPRLSSRCGRAVGRGNRPGLRDDGLITQAAISLCTTGRRTLLLSRLPRAASRRSRAATSARAVRDVLDTLARWPAAGTPVATATVVKTERSAPRDPGAVLAVSESGDVAGSVTGGCVEPAVFDEARDVLAGGPPRLVTYGIADEEAFEVGLPCGGTVHIFVDALDPASWSRSGGRRRRAAGRPRRARVRPEHRRASASSTPTSPPGTTSRAPPRSCSRRATPASWRSATRRSSSTRSRPGRTCTSSAPSTTPPPSREIGRFLGFRVTVCDARARFVTPERFPDGGRARRRVARPVPRAGARRRAHGDLRADARPQVRRPAAQGRARDAGRLHRRDGQPPHERRPRRAAARRGRHGRGARPPPCSDRPQDRLAHAAGGRHRDRGPDRAGAPLRPSPRRPSTR